MDGSSLFCCFQAIVKGEWERYTLKWFNYVPDFSKWLCSLLSLLTRMHTSTFSSTSVNASKHCQKSEMDQVAENPSQDNGTGNDVNVSHFLSLFRRLTSEEQHDLYKQLGIRHESEIYRFFGCDVQPEMNVEEVNTLFISIFSNPYKTSKISIKYPCRLLYSPWYKS